MRSCLGILLLTIICSGQTATRASTGHTYILGATVGTVWDARNEAASFGGHLVTINDQAENDWLRRTFSGAATIAWIGLNDERQEGTFEWDSGETATYRNWRTGEPNGGTAENHVLIWLNSAAGHWSDWTGTASQAPGPTRGLIEVPAPCGSPGAPTNGALSLDGFNGQVTVSDDPVLNAHGAMTVEAWVRPLSYPTGSGQVVSKKRRFPNWAGFTLHLQNGVVTFGVFQGTAGPAYREANAPWSTVPLGEWTHLAGVTDGSDVILFVDGAEVARSPAAGGVAPAGQHDLRIGRDNEAPQHNPSTWLHGEVDNVRLWDTARSAAEIRRDLDRDRPSGTGLLASWLFEGDLRDEVSGLVGTAFGGASLVASCRPAFCPPTTACLTANSLLHPGGTLNMQLRSQVSRTPAFVLGNPALASVPLTPWGTSQIALDAATVAFADPTGVFGPGLAPPYTDTSGEWRLTLHLPNDPGLSGLSLFVEGYVLDFFAPNGAFHQSNLLALVVQ